MMPLDEAKAELEERLRLTHLMYRPGEDGGWALRHAAAIETVLKALDAAIEEAATTSRAYDLHLNGVDNPIEWNRAETIRMLNRRLAAAGAGGAKP